MLIDTGAAKLFGPTLGNLQDSIKAAGYTPEQVDEIYITHMHADHVGGLMAGDKIAFPNAIVRSDKRDADFRLSKENLDKAPAEAKGFFQGAQASVNPYSARSFTRRPPKNASCLPQRMRRSPALAVCALRVRAMRGCRSIIQISSKNGFCPRPD